MPTEISLVMCGFLVTMRHSEHLDFTRILPSEPSMNFKQCDDYPKDDATKRKKESKYKDLLSTESVQ
ncbi:hypothetical protein KIN20_026991 [Parelaphostrongylus tenuis]|uniref:Uncharacterized protein n=1 Tax=Parelaphostrongylus tenuis TaxID=148309 RepID=A0AAD5WDF5_PARTN|nr:hypothetical protein KIN20_026991 [Parelaphostrongylus tenuis]